MSERKDKKPKKKLAITAIIIATLPLAFLIFYFCIWFTSDRIARNTYNGLDNMFVSHDEYFAIAGPFHVMIPKALAQITVDDEARKGALTVLRRLAGAGCSFLVRHKSIPLGFSENIVKQNRCAVNIIGTDIDKRGRSAYNITSVI